MKTSYRIPSKVFLIGEYGVLGNGRALVAAISPDFRWTQGLANQWSLSDPHEGRGGFGASSARFLGEYAVQEGLEAAQSPEAARKAYRDAHSGDDLPPSGADVACQSMGGIVLVDAHEESVKSVPLPSNAKDLLLVFSATGDENRKTPTDLHLSDFRARESRMKEWIAIADRAIEAFLEGNWEAFSRALTWFARSLGNAGLECKASEKDREVFLSIDGVWGVKGCGAMLSDAVIVALNPEKRDARSAVLETAESRDLVFLGSVTDQRAGISA